MAKGEDKFTLVEKDDGAWALLRELVAAHHTELAEASIGLVWMHEVKADSDGHLVWGRAKKVGPLERKFHEHDFVILLNALVWRELPMHGRRALVDHELSHCGVKTNDDGDESFYMRRHDLEEFVHVARRYGLWRPDLEALVNAAIGRDQPELFDEKKREAVGAATSPADETSDEIEH